MYYILFFSIFALLSFNNDKLSKIKNLDLFIFISIIIGSSLRWETGGDWARYTEYLDEIFTVTSPNQSTLFYAINSICNIFGLNVLGKNIVISIIFLVPFFYIFKKSYQNTYLALCIFFPIIFIIYGLGSIRQGLAMSYFFLFLHYNENKFIKFLIFLVPFFFHPASLILYILYLTSKIIKFDNKIVFFKRSIIILIFIIILTFFSYDYLMTKIHSYVTIDTYQSVGAPIRAVLLSFFSLIFLIKFNKLNIENQDIKNFLFYSSILVIFLTFFSYHFSVIVDRILGFFLILKLMIVNEIIKSTKFKSEIKLYSIIFILVNYLYLVLWIFFGREAGMWLRFQLPFI